MAMPGASDAPEEDEIDGSDGTKYIYHGPHKFFEKNLERLAGCIILIIVVIGVISWLRYTKTTWRFWTWGRDSAKDHKSTELTNQEPQGFIFLRQNLRFWLLPSRPFPIPPCPQKSATPELIQPERWPVGVTIHGNPKTPPMMTVNAMAMTSENGKPFYIVDYHGKRLPYKGKNRAAQPPMPQRPLTPGILTMGPARDLPLSRPLCPGTQALQPLRRHRRLERNGNGGLHESKRTTR